MMQDATQSRHNHHEQVQAHDRGIPREDERILATVPSQTSIETYPGDSPHPEIYRQALKSILTTPDIENRLNYITASMIVTIFGGWLAGKMVQTRAFIFFTDLLLFFTSLAMAGFLAGVMLGENILPAETVPILLLAATAIVLLIMGFVLGSMIVGATRHSKARAEGTSARDIVVPMRQRRYAGRARGRNGYSHRSTDHA
ncbi:MAG: hypothetical protein KGJ80_06175 [Chloroflexota bacterium]|nr:hypothetical protein [Chloroflexota bacterium]